MGWLQIRKVDMMICLMKDGDGMTAMARMREAGLAAVSAKEKLIDREHLNQVNYTRGAVILLTNAVPGDQLNRIPGDF